MKGVELCNVEENTMNGTVKRIRGMAAAVGCLMLLSGCEWWPPALQERLAQQSTQVQDLGMENAALQGKVMQATKAAGECAVHVEQATKTHADLQAQVDQLKAALEEAEAKLAKKGKPAKK